MSNRFDPRLVQADYLRQAGFRQTLIIEVGEIFGTKGLGENLQWFRFVESILFPQPLWFWARPRWEAAWDLSNRVIKEYELGEPIKLKEFT